MSRIERTEPDNWHRIGWRSLVSEVGMQCIDNSNDICTLTELCEDNSDRLSRIEERSKDNADRLSRIEEKLAHIEEMTEKILSLMAKEKS